jgi:hypothetical protein
MYTSFALQKNAKDLSAESSIYGCFDSAQYPYYVIDSASNTITIDRSTYTSQKKYALPSGGKYLTASQVTDLFNAHLRLSTALFDRYLYRNLGFGLGGLGFISFSGYGTTVCDPIAS